MSFQGRTPSNLSAEDHDLAYDYFNHRLFGGLLPPCLITLSSRPGYRGYFRRKFFQNQEQVIRDELAMNPEGFANVRDYLSTLVHEQAHVWQEYFGKPGKGAYHNRQWAQMMVQLGLPPFNVTHPDKMTGTRISHTIQEGGVFDLACAELLRGGFQLRWWHEANAQPHKLPEDVERERKSAERKQKRLASKTPYSCPGCGAKAWAKPGIKLLCGNCIKLFQTEEATEPEGGEEVAPPQNAGTEAAGGV